MNPLTLEIDHLSVVYQTDEGILPAARGISLGISRRETLGLVGESGSGKTTVALGAIRYLPPNGRIEGGTARLEGIDLLGLAAKEVRRIWGSKIGLVSQDPQAAMNPSLPIGRQLDEMGRRHLDLRRKAARELSISMLGRVGLPDPHSVVDRYPHQLSGGMLQRCAIAMALLPHPALLILDEPTTSLDVTTQAMVLDLLDELKSQFDMAVLYITHNLGVIARICDRVAVMYAGEILEEAPVAELFERSLHPYTLNLLHCVPRLTRTWGKGPPGATERLATIPGSLPRLDGLPPGCIFAPRCPLALDSCRVSRPPLVEVATSHQSACLRWQVLLSGEGQSAAVQVEAGGSDVVLAAQPRVARLRRTGTAERAGAPENHPTSLLWVDDAAKTFPSRRARSGIKAVDGVTLSVAAERTLGLVGESGSGKTTLARLVVGLTSPTRGSVYLDDSELKPDVGRRQRSTLRRLQMVFQSPEASLNPRRTVGEALVRTLVVLAGLERKTAAVRAYDLLKAVRLPPSHFHRYPGELSGGEKQRVAIARAFAGIPDVVICDEPVSSLDVSVQGSLMNLLLDLQEQAGTSYVFISHDLAAVQHLSHSIGVMYLGKLMEVGEAARVLAPPYHPYTEVLLSAVPVPDSRVREPREGLRGSAPDSAEIPSGCRFYPRCPRELGDICRLQEPPWRLSDGRVIPATPRGAASDRSVGGEPMGPAASAAAEAHAVYCHIPLEELSRLQERE